MKLWPLIKENEYQSGNVTFGLDGKTIQRREFQTVNFPTRTLTLRTYPVQANSRYITFYHKCLEQCGFTQLKKNLTRQSTHSRSVNHPMWALSGYTKTKQQHWSSIEQETNKRTKNFKNKEKKKQNEENHIGIPDGILVLFIKLALIQLWLKIMVGNSKDRLRFSKDKEGRVNYKDDH